MKKYLWAIVAAVMVAGVITFVACKKDPDATNVVNPTSMPTKGGEAFNKLCNIMAAYYAACDSAYQVDSTKFLAICANNDTVNFRKATGISSSMLLDYREFALRELDEFVKDNPNFEPDEDSCIACTHKALPRLGTLASATSGHLKAFVPIAIGDFDRNQLANCIRWCKEMSSPFSMAACISACMGEYKYSLYTSEYVFASYKVGSDSISFEIPKDRIMAVMEMYFSSLFGNVVIEDVKVVDEHPFSHEYNACIEIDFFNIERGTSTKVAAVIDKHIDQDRGIVLYETNNQGGKKQTVKCESEGCGQGECKVMYDSHGTPEDCTNCKKKCHKTITSSDSTPGFWDVVITIVITILKVNGPLKYK